MKPIKVNLGPVRLAFAIGDADKDGTLDVQVHVRVVGLVEWSFPPMNLDAAAAEAAKDAFERVVEKFRKK